MILRWLLGLGVLACLSATAMADTPAPAPPEAPTVTIDTGTLVGQVVDQARVFRAIPYAAPPVGPLRWRPPQPATSWTGPRDATQDGPACPQVVYPGRYNDGGYQGPTSEDCLTLDVFAPLHAVRAPVLVWIFGGGDTAGADSIAPNDGRSFARDGVIVVAMNYRLGALGFFAHPSLTREAGPREPLANYGLMDQIAALEWVKRNIARFGGDPSNVTISGESAGGENVVALMVIPAARGLFSKATVQSGVGWEKPLTLAESEATGVAVAQKLGLGADATPAQLRALPVEKLVGVVRARPVIDGRLMTEGSEQGFARGDQAPAPLIIGANSWEASLLPKAGYAAYAAGLTPAVRAAYPEDANDPAKLAQDAFGDLIMTAPARWYAAQASKKAGAWLYEFSYVRVAKRGQIPGANHTSENPYVFDTQMIVPGYSSEIVEADRKVAAFMHSCWVSFAKSGRPTCEADGRAWPAYSPARDELMLFDDPSRVVAHFRKPQLDAQQAAQGAAVEP